MHFSLFIRCIFMIWTTKCRHDVSNLFMSLTKKTSSVKVIVHPKIVSSFAVLVHAKRYLSLNNEFFLRIARFQLEIE